MSALEHVPELTGLVIEDSSQPATCLSAVLRRRGIWSPPTVGPDGIAWSARLKTAASARWNRAIGAVVQWACHFWGCSAATS